MNELRLASAPFNDFIQVLFRLLNKLIDAVLICKYAILLSVFKHTQVRFSRHQQPIVLDDIYQAKSEEIEWYMHKIRG
jgi:hypothetical protein